MFNFERNKREFGEKPINGNIKRTNIMLEPERMFHIKSGNKKVFYYY